MQEWVWLTSWCKPDFADLYAVRLSHRDTEPLPSLTGWLWRSLSFAEQVLPPILLCTCSCTHDEDGDEAASSPLLCSGLEGSLHRKQHVLTEEASLKTPFSWLPFPNSLCSKDSLCLTRPAGFREREVFIVHSKSNVTQVRKHLLYMTVNPVIRRGLWEHTRSNTAQQMFMEMAQNQTKCRTIVSSGFVPQKKKDMPRGSVMKAYQESKLGGNGADTQTEMSLLPSACLGMAGSPQERSWLFPSLLPTFFCSAESLAHSALLQKKRTSGNIGSILPALCYSAC